MRAISTNALLFHPTATVEPAKVPEAGPVNPVVAALHAFPEKLAAAMASMKAPVMAPRPEGSWIIDVSRDSKGQMTQLTGKFHENK